MSRASTPVQFILDEESASHSSATESLLGRVPSPSHPHSHQYPPAAADPAGDDDGEKNGRSSSRNNRPPAAAHVAVRIPTREQVLLAKRAPRERPRHWTFVAVGLAALLAAAWTLTYLLSLGSRFGGQPRMQVILMISDGMGPASETMARSYVQYLYSTNSSTSGFKRSLLNETAFADLASGYRGRPEGSGRLPLDDILVGTSRTRSSNSLITDSAAGATAFSCALKTYNGGIGLTPSLQPCGTILEAAKRQGFSTGLVATSRLTHATPASFYAHVPDRDLEGAIARFLVGEAGTALKGLPVDIALGGGGCYFRPNGTSGSCREDGEDLLEKARGKGVRVLEGMAALRAYKEEDAQDAPVLGLFADDHMSYEIDREVATTLAEEQPSLREMATHALQYLSRRGSRGKGFFLMIEGSRIDMAAHNNDPVGHVYDMLAYHQTVQYVRKWVEEQNDAGTPTMLISVSDHETGGLALGRQLGEAYPEYLWYPDMLANATHSTSYLGALFASQYPAATREWVVSELFIKGLGITDAASAEVDAVWMARTDAYGANRALADAISRRAQVGWSTAGHSGIDVNLYAAGHNSTGLTGNVENTDIGEHIAHNMVLVTIELAKGAKSWFDASAGNGTSRTSGLQHYHGDF
ncbi:vacuolar alkaline phosphatase [Rhodotorula kratochvilovae]